MNKKNSFINTKIFVLLKKFKSLYKDEGIKGLNNKIISVFKNIFNPNFIYNDINRIAIKTIKNAYEEQSEILAKSCSYIYQMAIEGDIAEFGTDEALTSIALASSVFQLNKFQRNDPRGTKLIHYFDSFEGFPSIDNEEDKKNKMVKYGTWKKGTCSSYSADDFKKKISQYLSCEFFKIHKGWYKNTLLKIKDSQKFSLIHIDCTLYESSKDVFENIFKRKLISIGGMILIKTFHQYLNSDSLGEQKAFLEMAEKYAVTFEDLGDYGSFSKRFLIKNIG